MSSGRDEGPVYYREIQKNAYLKRIPDDFNSGKLRPLVHKKPPLKPMWTLFCVHNGKTPYLEQYPQQDCPATHAHRPLWRACLKSTRHVTASVKPLTGQEYDFLIDTDSGPVRMLAPDWDAMQDWVTTLRNKLHELRILSRGENVYGAPPVAPVPRAAARDPNSPLPPTPPVPPDRVPGIELGPNIRPITTTSANSTEVNNTCTFRTCTTTINTNNNTYTHNTTTDVRCNVSVTTTNVNTTVVSTHDTDVRVIDTNVNRNSSNTGNSTEPKVINIAGTTNYNLLDIESVNTTLSDTDVTASLTNVRNVLNTIVTSDVDISNWDAPPSLPSTSREKEKTNRDKIESKSVAKICGQNVCLDDSILKRTSTNSDEDFFAELDKISDTVENLDDFSYTQRLTINDDQNTASSQSKPKRTNITVIQVSNKNAPHTAIPVVGPETNVFDFNFKQNVSVKPESPEIVNIVNTSNEYGTVFDKPDTDYGHISLTTTVTVTRSNSDSRSVTNVNGAPNSVNVQDTSIKRPNEGVYERLCLASTSNASPLSVRRVQNIDKARKSSLPNLDVPEATYECLFPSQNNDNRTNGGEINSNNVNLASNNIPICNSSVLTQNTAVNVTRANVDSTVRGLRSNVERSRSQNAYDSAPGVRERRRIANNSPKREVKNDKPEVIAQKPIWKRGLTELSLLTRLKSIGLKRPESPTRQELDNDRSVTSPVKVVHRSRGESRVDSSRRRSSSLSNGQPRIPQSPPGLLSLRARQAAALAAEQRRGACVATSVPARDPPVFCDYDKQIWVCGWGGAGVRCGGRAGDRLAAVCGAQPASAHHARQLIKASHRHMVDILFHRVPLGKMYVITKKDHESLGIKLDNECTIQSVEAGSPSARVGLPPGKWAVTEVNNRPINLLKGGEEEMNRLSARGTEVSILIQPTALVKKLRAAMKGRPLLAIR